MSQHSHNVAAANRGRRIATSSEADLASRPKRSRGSRPRPSARPTKAAPAAPARVRDLWVQVDREQKHFELVLPELPGVVGTVFWDGDPGPSMVWFVEIDGNEALDEHLGVEDTGRPINAAKAAAEAVMLPMLTGHGKIALVKRLQASAPTIRGCRR
jgi:hypothetical protein